MVESYHQSNLKSLKRSGVKEGYFKTDSLNMHYYAGGKGPALLFVHGFGGDAILSWKYFLKKYQKNYTVIAADILWFGESTSTYKPDLSSQAKAFHQLLDFLKIDSVSLVGQSYGGFIVMEMTKQDPNRVKELVIVNSPGPTFDITLLDTLTKKEGVQNVADFFVFDDYKGVNKLIELGYKHPTKVPKGIAQKTYTKYFKTGNPEKRQLLSSLYSDVKNLYNYFEHSKQKSLVIWTDSDKIFPLSEGKKLAHFLKSEIIVLKNTGHVSIIKRKRKGKKILDQFLTIPSSRK
jgi:pimeloyl-ACP methyl ester carboxylesterase